MESIAIIIVIIISLWSVTKTLEKLTDKILEKQNKQNELLEEIKQKLEENSNNRN
jgi:ABC-type bacteriocin/lantibiotic exporter with double-glycine peptidase domain